MVFTILLRQRKRIFCVYPAAWTGTQICFHLEMNIITAFCSCRWVELHYITEYDCNKDPTKVKWKQLLGFRNTIPARILTTILLPIIPAGLSQCETFQNDFCDVCKLQGHKRSSESAHYKSPALYVKTVPEGWKSISAVTEIPQRSFCLWGGRFLRIWGYQNDRNSRLLSGSIKTTLIIATMEGAAGWATHQVYKIFQVQANDPCAWVEHSNGEKKRSRQMTGFHYAGVWHPCLEEKANSGQRVRWITGAATLIPVLSTALWFTRFRRMPFCNPAIPSALRL